VQAENPTNPDGMGLFGSAQSVDGVDFSCGLQDPTGFSGGGWNYVQIVHLGRTRVVSGATQTLALWSQQAGIWTKIVDGLDTIYPYEPSADPNVQTWPANGTAHVSPDNVGEAFESGATSYTVNESFDTYVMYLPPGQGSVYVVMHHFGWHWGGQGTLSNGVWTVVPGTPGVAPNEETTTSPFWKVLFNINLATWR